MIELLTLLALFEQASAASLPVPFGAPIELEAPRYSNESLRVERRSAWGRIVKAVVVRHLSASYAKLDYIDTTWAGSVIYTLDLAKCTILPSELRPSSFTSKERTSDGSIVIEPDGPRYVGIAKAPYDEMIGGSQVSGNSLTPFGQWAEGIIELAESCRAPVR